MLFYEPYDENYMDLSCFIFTKSISNFFTTKPLNNDESKKKLREKEMGNRKFFSFLLDLRFGFEGKGSQL
jgi:hypothetical protein